MNMQTSPFFQIKPLSAERGNTLILYIGAAALLGSCACFGAADSQPTNTKETNEERSEQNVLSFSGSGYFGYRHDSNVSVSELDTNSDVADGATQLDAQLKVTVKPNDKWETALSISQANTQYQTLSAFDLALTTLSASTSYAFDFAKLGLHYYHAGAKLDGRDFLTYQQYGMSAGKLFGQRTYLRISSDIIDKQFENIPENEPNRDSEAIAVRSDLFYFFEGQDFFQIALKYQNEKAQNTAFDYSGRGIDLAYTYPFAIFSKPLDITFAYQLDVRDYASRKSGGIGREDDRHVVKMRADYAVHDNVDIRLSTQYGDFASSVEGANYKETIAEVGINVHF